MTSSLTPKISAPQSASTHQVKSSKSQLNPQDFIKMMITQLQNQDPMQPAKNEELLAQMSQIGQLQSATMLQQSLQGMVLQNQIGSAGNLIGKSVQGMDDQNNTIGGVVSSVKVEDQNVFLQLDTGKSLALGRVTSIAAAPATSTAGGTSAGLQAAAA